MTRIHDRVAFPCSLRSEARCWASRSVRRSSGRYPTGTSGCCESSASITSRKRPETFTCRSGESNGGILAASSSERIPALRVLDEESENREADQDYAGVQEQGVAAADEMDAENHVEQQQDGQCHDRSENRSAP